MENHSLKFLSKNKEVSYKQIIEMSKNYDYTTGNLLDYEYFSKNYRLIAIDLIIQIELENPDLILLEVLKEMRVQPCSLLLRKKKKPLLISHKIL